MNPATRNSPKETDHEGGDPEPLHLLERPELSESTTTPVRSAQAWRRHLDAWKESGLNQRAYCRELGIGFHRFRYWRSKLEQPERTCPFGKRA
jgi:hypothetical protein